jgi:Stage II sporulation protein E (SpoIIE)/GAF domain
MATVDSDELRKRAIEQLEAERDRLERLLLRLPALLAELEVERLARGIAEAARDLVDARFGIFVPFDGDEEAAIFAGLDRDAFATRPAIAHAPLLAGVLWRGETLLIEDVATWASRDDSVRAHGVLADGRLPRSWLAAPVRGRSGTVLGAIYLGHHRAHAFSPRQEELLGGLCAQLGVAMENAALFAERSRVAAALQETLLPPLLPGIPGVDVATRYRPTGAGNLVGGDFYDVFELGAQTWGLLVGDVSGFGPEAAALTGLARYAIRAVAATERRPSAVLAQLNETMLRQRLEERFFTAVYAVVAPSEDGVEVTLSSAGHPPAALLRDDETVELLDRRPGMLLGLFPEPELEDERVLLGPGDALVLYTDGVVEARDDRGSQFGFERLEALLSTCAGRSADGIARRLELAVLDHQGDKMPDDVAILVLRAQPSPVQ